MEVTIKEALEELGFNGIVFSNGRALASRYGIEYINMFPSALTLVDISKQHDPTFEMTISFHCDRYKIVSSSHCHCLNFKRTIGFDMAQCFNGWMTLLKEASENYS